MVFKAGKEHISIDNPTNLYLDLSEELKDYTVSAFKKALESDAKRLDTYAIDDLNRIMDDCMLFLLYFPHYESLVCQCQNTLDCMDLF
jgi:hypothetical protein